MLYQGELHGSVYRGTYGALFLLAVLVTQQHESCKLAECHGNTGKAAALLPVVIVFVVVFAMNRKWWGSSVVAFILGT
jgi:hypothetical protein